MAYTITPAPGTLSIAHDSLSVVGVGTIFTAYRKGALINVPGLGAQQLAETPTDDLLALLVSTWGFADAVAKPFEVWSQSEPQVYSERVRQLIEKLGDIGATGLQPSAVGEFADRDDFDAQAKGYVYLSLDGDGTDITTAVFFIKASGTSGDWDGPIAITGPQGPSGLIGVWRGPWVTAHAYVVNDVVSQGGSSYICMTAHTSGTFATDLAAVKWQLVVSKGDAGTPAPASSQVDNLGMAFSVSAGALTAAIKQKDGATDPAASPANVSVGMRSATAASGAFNQRSIAAALSLAVTSGATLGHANTVAAQLYWYLLDNAGTLELAVSGIDFGESSIQSSTAMSAAADLATVLYSTTARANVPCRKIAQTTDTQTVAGTWAAVPSAVNLLPLAAPAPVLASQAEAEAGTDNTKTMTPLRTLQAIVALGGAGAVSDKTANYTVTTGDRNAFIAVDASGAARTVTLPAAATAGAGFEVSIAKSDSSANAVTIDGNASETVDGATTYLLWLRSNAVKLRCDGTNWRIVTSHLPTETGSNANGTYVKDADGTLTCWITNSVSGTWSTTSWGTWYGPAAYTWPAAFIATPVASQSSSDGQIASRSGYITFMTATATGVTFYLASPAAAPVAASVGTSVIAKGRWRT